MRPETREILDTIGWQAVLEKYPETAMRLAKALIKQPGGPLAKIQIEQIDEVEDAIERLSTAMSGLSSRLIESIDEWFDAEEPSGIDGYPMVWDTYVACRKLLPAIKASRDLSERIVRNSSAGSISPRTGQVRKPRTPMADDTLYVIADALAEVYLFGLRSYPTVGTDGDKGAVNGQFCRILSAVFRSENYPIPASKTVVNMANAAKRELKYPKVKKALRENAATLHRWQASRYYAIATRKVIWRDMRDEEYGLWWMASGGWHMVGGN